MEKKLINSYTGEVLNFGPSCVRSFEGKKDFDKYYIDKEIKQVVNKVGEGEEDYIIVDKEIVSRRDIAQFIHSQASSAGVDAYLAPYLETGEKVPNVTVNDSIQDFSQMPDNLADACLLGDKATKAFKALDKDLVGNMTYEEFMNSFTKEKFDAYIASKTAETPKKGD